MHKRIHRGIEILMAVIILSLALILIHIFNLFQWNYILRSSTKLLLYLRWKFQMPQRLVIILLKTIHTDCSISLLSHVDTTIINHTFLVPFEFHIFLNLIIMMRSQFLINLFVCILHNLLFYILSYVFNFIHAIPSSLRWLRR